jgi:tyrosyl-tRNA synthetase
LGTAIDREVERQLDVMRRGAVALIGEEELRTKLMRGLREARPLRVKLGMDPSAPDLHLGHSVVLQKLRMLQDLGHVPIFLIGDFTARIGDPSGKRKTRPALDVEQVRRNAETYVSQVSRVLDTSRIEIRYNSEWMDQVTAADVVRLCSHTTVARMLERDDFAKRYLEQAPIAVHEFLYPLVQAYDSVALNADIELGGTDQTFNLLLGREIQRAYAQEPQVIITHPLLVGTDGREKMSKSIGNVIGISDSPSDIYGRCMSISDELMLVWFDQLEAGEWPELSDARHAFDRGAGTPLEFKHALAAKLVTRLWGASAAEAAARQFRDVVQRGQIPAEVPEHFISLGERTSIGILSLLSTIGLAASNSDARRLVGQGGVLLDGARVSNPNVTLGAGRYMVRVGKRHHARVVVS